MATNHVQPDERPASPGAYTAQLSRFARLCAEHCPDPAVLDQIAQIFSDAAAELRSQGRH